jgi:N-methylhydantoinase B
LSDPIELAIFQSAVHSIAEEMGAALLRTALSPNIKERRDYSCAIFDAQARVIAMGDHMPVHLGSMPMSVQAAIAAISFVSGDIAILNDPFAGGTHLPDITMVLPVFVPGLDTVAFYVANRAHHADVGGTFPGSMGPASEIFQEGLRIPPVRIVRGGQIDREMLNLILLNVRTPNEREGDLESQIGACRVGQQRLLQLVEKYGAAHLQTLIEELLDYSERLVRAQLREIPAGECSAGDWLDDDGVSDEPRRIAVRLRFDPAAASLARPPRWQAVSTQFAPSRSRRASTCCAACLERTHPPPREFYGRSHCTLRWAVSWTPCPQPQSPAATWRLHSALSMCCSAPWHRLYLRVFRQPAPAP